MGQTGIKLISKNLNTIVPYGEWLCISSAADRRRIRIQFLRATKAGVSYFGAKWAFAGYQVATT
jgi:hypothetical protein